MKTDADKPNDSWESEVRDAFERMTPPPEVEDRMLAALLVAADGNASADKGAGAGEHANDLAKRLSQPSASGAAAAAEPPQPLRPNSSRPIFKTRRFAVSLAACLALLAGLGALVSVAELTRMPSTTSASDMQCASSESAPNAASSAEEGGEVREGAEGLIEDRSGSGNAAAAIDAPSGGETDIAASETAPASAYPLIDLPSGAQARVAVDDEGSPLVIDASLVGDLLGAATAHDETRSLATACTVHAYGDEAHSYAVLYDNDVFYLANDA